MSEQAIRNHHPEGAHRDEGGPFDVVKAQVPSWVSVARKHCAGCHDNFYNGRQNCTGKSWCWSLKKSHATRKTRPLCHH